MNQDLFLTRTRWRGCSLPAATVNCCLSLANISGDSLGCGRFGLLHSSTLVIIFHFFYTWNHVVYRNLSGPNKLWKWASLFCFLSSPALLHSFPGSKLSNRTPQGSSVSKEQPEMTGKRVLPKHESKVKTEGVPCPLTGKYAWLHHS